MKTFLKFTALSAGLLMLVVGCQGEEEKETEQELQQICIKEWCFETSGSITDVVMVALIGGQNTTNSVSFVSSDLKNGHVTITPPDVLCRSFLSPLNRGTLWLLPIQVRPSTLTISNDNVNIGTLDLVGFNGRGRDVASFFLYKIHEGVFYAGHFIYVDSDVTISGYVREQWGVSSPTMPIVIATNVIYSVELKKGWNLVWFSNSGGVTGTTTVRTQCILAPDGEVRWGAVRF